MLLALAAGGLTAYWLVGRRGLAPALPVGSSAIPDDALMTLTFSTDEEQWRQLRQLGTRDTQAQLNQYIATWRDRLLTDMDLSYGRDIAPWVGDAITVAFLDSDSGQPLPEIERDPDAPDANPFDPAQMALGDRAVAWILPIDQSVAAQSALSQLEVAGTPAQRNYQGFDLYELQGGESQASYWATVLDRRLLAIATGAADLEAIVDAYEDGTSVADAPGYRQAAQQVSKAQPLLQVYINSNAAASVSAANSVDGAPQSIVPLRQESQGLAATASLVETGVEIDGVTWLKAGAPTFTGSPVEDVASFLSPDTVLVMAGGNLQRLWQDLQEGAQETGFLSPGNIRSLVDGLTGLSVDEDLVPWMADEYALSLVATNSPADEAADSAAESAAESAAGNMALTLQLKTGDRPAAEKALDRLDEAVRRRYDFQIAQDVVDGVPAVQWSSPFAALQVTRTWVDDDRVSIVVGSAAPLPASSLDQSEIFQQALASDPLPTGYFYVSPQRLIALDRGLPLPSMPPTLQSLAEAIQAIGFKTTIPSDRTLRFDISVLVDQLGDAGALPAPGAATEQPGLDPEESAAGQDSEAADEFTAPPQ